MLSRRPGVVVLSRRAGVVVLSRRAGRLRTALRAGLPALGLLTALGAAGGTTAAAAASPPSGLAGQVRSAEMPALEAIAAPVAWRQSRGQGITVGVLDTGVGAGAPDLAGSVASGPDYAAGVNPPGYQPPHLHGTFISSLIAGHGSGPGRAGGVIGVAPEARILSVRVLPDDQEPGLQVYNDSPKYDDAVARGVRYAVRHRVSVINMSLGSTSPNRGLRAAIAYAIAHDVVVVAAAGNSGSGPRRFSPYSYPASFPGVIAVAAVSDGGRRASFSDHNASVEISAPGVNVVGAAPGGNYLRASGTSPASALVAGVATLIRSEHPRLPPALVAQAIITTAQHRPAHGYSPGVGFGEVNASAALRAAGRLAALRPAAGLPPSARAVAGRSGPIQVVHRNAARIFTFGGVSTVGVLGFLAALIALALLASRSLRDRRAYPGGPPAGLPPGYPPPPPWAGYPRPVPPGSGWPGAGPSAPRDGPQGPAPVPPWAGQARPVPPGSGWPGAGPSAPGAGCQDEEPPPPPRHSPPRPAQPPGNAQPGE